MSDPETTIAQTAHARFRTAFRSVAPSLEHDVVEALAVAAAEVYARLSRSVTGLNELYASALSVTLDDAAELICLGSLVISEAVRAHHQAAATFGSPSYSSPATPLADYLYDRLRGQEVLP